jgi:hypothetical protein
MPSNFLIRKQGFALWIPIELHGYLLPGQRERCRPRTIGLRPHFRPTIQATDSN